MCFYKIGFPENLVQGDKPESNKHSKRSSECAKKENRDETFKLDGRGTPEWEFQPSGVHIF